MSEHKQPDCLYPEEIQALVVSFKRIVKYNNENKRFGTTGSIAYTVIQQESNKWIRLLDVTIPKRRT